MEFPPERMLKMSIKLIDLYSGNKFDPSQIIADGYTGVIFKGGQGAWADVPRYQPTWWNLAAEYGLHRGWYWLCDSRHAAPDHIREMKAWKIFQDVGEFGIWIDMEKPVLSMTERDYWKTPYAGHRNVVDLAYLIHIEGYVPGIYTGPGAYELIMRGAPQTAHDVSGTHDLWTAQYPYVYLPGISKPKLYGLGKIGSGGNIGKVPMSIYSTVRTTIITQNMARDQRYPNHHHHQQEALWQHKKASPDQRQTSKVCQEHHLARWHPFR